MWCHFLVMEEYSSQVNYDWVFIEVDEVTKNSPDWAFSMLFNHTHQFYLRCNTCEPLIENVKEYECAEEGFEYRVRVITIEEMQQLPAFTTLDTPLGVS